MKKYSLLLLLLYSTISCAGIKVSPLLLRFNPTDSYKDLTISNVGPTIQYVKIVPQLIVIKNNKTRRVKIKNPRKLGLLVTPSKLVLPPNQSQVTRVVLIKPTDKVERDYVISVIPAIGSIIYKQIVGKNKKTRVAMKLIIGYDILTIINPKNPHLNISLKRKGRKIYVKNSGNIGIVLRKARQCDKHKRCIILKKVGAKILYPSLNWKFTGPKAGPISFEGTLLGRVAKKIKLTSN